MIQRERGPCLPESSVIFETTLSQDGIATKEADEKLIALASASLCKFFAPQVNLDGALPKLQLRATDAVTSLVKGRKASPDEIAATQSLVDVVAKLGADRDTLQALLQTLSLAEAFFPLAQALEAAQTESAEGKTAFLENQEREIAHLLSLLQKLEEAQLDDTEGLMNEAQQMKKALTDMARNVVSHKLTAIETTVRARAHGENWKADIQATTPWASIVEKGRHLVDVLALPLDREFKASEEACYLSSWGGAKKST